MERWNVSTVGYILRERSWEGEDELCVDKEQEGGDHSLLRGIIFEFLWPRYKPGVVTYVSIISKGHLPINIFVGDTSFSLKGS